MKNIVTIHKAMMDHGCLWLWKEGHVPGVRVRSGVMVSLNNRSHDVPDAALMTEI